MSLLIAPYNNAMRLGQGFNSYTQQICVDDAVVIDPERAENILSNDGSTMRTMAQMLAKPSAWTRQKEVVLDKRSQSAVLEVRQQEVQAQAQLTQIEESPAAEEPPAPAGEAGEAAADVVEASPEAPSTAKSDEFVDVDSDPSNIDDVAEEGHAQVPHASQPRSTASAVGKAKLKAATGLISWTPRKASTETSTKEDAAEAALRKKEEQELLADQRAYQKELAKEAREDERERRRAEREEQKAIAQEKREFDRKRREEMRQKIDDAASSKAQALSLADLEKIKAQNQFIERFNGMPENEGSFTFDHTAPLGPSQTVTFTSRFVDKLSDVTDDMCISGSLSIKAAKIGGSGKGSFVDSDKFKESDLNFFISVKVVNQTVNFKDALVFNPLRSVNADNFQKVYGDSFVSGFLEGGEFNAIVSMKIHNKAKMTDIKAEAKVALTAGPVDITAEANVGIARANLETNTETTIQVSWAGGGQIKPMEQQWDIKSLMAAAARFPDLVAQCPQRTYAILTKYDTLRSFIARQPASYTPLQYENAQIYTNALLDSFMSYKTLYKQLGEQVSLIQNKTLEVIAWSDSNGDAAAAAADQSTTNVVVKKGPDGFYPYVEDLSRFDASIKGLSDARKAIRRQMARIVNEVDVIEKDPKLATDEDHKEPFQSPATFETRVPKTKVPEELQNALRSDPLTGKRIMAKTQTEEELEAERERQVQAAALPSLYEGGPNISMEEQAALDAIKAKQPHIGEHLRVSSAFGTDEKEKGAAPFSNLDFLQPEWMVRAVTVEVFEGALASISITYDNGLISKKGASRGGKVHEITMQQKGERFIAGTIVTGARAGSKTFVVLALRLYTNRGRRLLAGAETSRPGDGGKVVKDGVEYEKISVETLDVPFPHGTLKGFFGYSVDTAGTGSGIYRLGLVWGDLITESQITTAAGAMPIENEFASADDLKTSSQLSASEAALQQARAELEQVRREKNSLAGVVNDIPEVNVFRLTYGGKDYLDGHADRIIQLIYHHNAITMDNNLYNDDPRPGQRKQGCIIWQRRGEKVQRVDPWEGEVVRF